MPEVPARASPARRCAFTVLRRTFEDGAHTDQALRAEADRARLGPRDRALARRLAYGAVQRRATLDHLIEALAERPVARLDGLTLAALRLGVFQVCFLDGVPAHAAVHEAVELAKADGAHGHGLVNAVLRRAVREAPARLAALDDATPARAALRHSHPEWVARLWWEHLGAEGARALLGAGNEPPEVALRANTLVTTPAALGDALRAQGVASRPAEGAPEGLVLEDPFDAPGSDLFAAGAFMPQSRASMLVARILAPRPGERVLDLCAAPGTKSTHLAALMEDRGSVVAVERDPGRARALRETARRLHTGCVEVREADAREPQGEGFDRVLVDPPCSGLGTLRGRPDRRWRAREEDVAGLAARQREILVAAAAAVRPGGSLVYSTCTISPAENEDVVAAFLGERAEFATEDLTSDHPLWKHPTVPAHLLLLPHRDGTDGFFIARLRRRA